MKHSIFAILILLPMWAWSQYTSGFQQEYFFGNLPNARTEAMARAGVAAGEGTSNLFLNPATLGLTEDLDAVFSTSAPFYVLQNSNYFFVGLSKRFTEKLVGAFSVHTFAVGPTTFDINFGSKRFPLDKSFSTNIALSGAYELLPGLHAGLNFNMYRWTYIDEVNAVHQGHLDGGLLYNLSLDPGNAQSKNLRIGASVSNFTSSDITFFSPENDSSTQEFPIVLRLGGAYQVATDINYPVVGSGPFAFTATVEYQNVLNNNFRTAFQVGTEAVLYDVLAVRLGGFTRSEDDGGRSDVNFDRINDVTYGFGFKVPLSELSDGKIPGQLWIDYASLEPPPTSTLGGRKPNFRTFTIRLVLN
jgi:hypothetical protein